MRELKKVSNPRCTLCNLHKIAGKVCISGDGRYTQKAFVVGEAPGRDEDRVGRPFVGRAGRLLRRELVVAGIRPSQIYLTNAVKCFPARTPTDEEIQICSRYLRDEIELGKPSWMLCLGGVALAAATTYEGRISEIRGQVVPSKFGTTLCLPTWHPAYLLRNSSKLPEWRNDLGIFSTLLEYDL